MMISIKRILLLLILTFNIVFTQYPSASFEYDEYLFDENLDRAFVTLQIENPDLMDLGGITLFLYADTSVIKFDSESVSENAEIPFNFFVTSNAYNNPDTLKIAATTAESSENFTVPFAKIFDISFQIVGEANENTFLEFITFHLG